VDSDVEVLPGAWNFRDVAAAAATDGAALRPGRFFRSSELSRLDDSGRELLRRLGITDVADLRSPREVERRGPGRVPDGVVVHLLPFPDLAATSDKAPHEQAFQRIMLEKADDETVGEAARRFMTDEYQRFPKLGGAQRAVQRVVSLLSDGRPVITHCFAGKDRTGFTVAVVLEGLGLGRDAIMADFLRSNDAAPELRSRILDMIRNRSGEGLTPEAITFAEARLTDEVLGVREEYLEAARRTIDQDYGSLDGYLRAAGVTEDDVAALRAALLT
jgi:protein-tyrosine phosphatase